MNRLFLVCAGGVGAVVIGSAAIAGDVTPCPVPNQQPFPTCITVPGANWCIQKTAPDGDPPVAYPLVHKSKKELYFEVAYLKGEIQQNTNATPDVGFEQISTKGVKATGPLLSPTSGSTLLHGGSVSLLLYHGCGARAQGTWKYITKSKYRALIRQAKVKAKTHK